MNNQSSTKIVLKQVDILLDIHMLIEKLKLISPANLNLRGRRCLGRRSSELLNFWYQIMEVDYAFKLHSEGFE
jgi:hypothetical protein